jgi:hypothetical protein
MGGAGPKGFKQAEMKKGKPQRNEGSEGSSKIRQIFSSLKERWSSRLSPLPGAPQATPVPEFDERDARGARIFRKERFDVLQRLLKNIQEKEIFWEQDIQVFFERISQLFDEGCGPYDMYNQRCCVAVIALAETMHRGGEGLEKIKRLGSAKYLEWAALNSIDSGMRKVSVLFLKKMGEWNALGRIASPSNKDEAIRKMAQKMVLGSS